ncbi:hypothetical protein XZ12_004647, partial [Salmonella enterica subsp. enterica]|nr:hypothetical protein [Salmonella enterica subsp. enterica serovar Bareilly]
MLIFIRYFSVFFYIGASFCLYTSAGMRNNPFESCIFPDFYGFFLNNVRFK